MGINVQTKWICRNPVHFVNGQLAVPQLCVQRRGHMLFTIEKLLAGAAATKPIDGAAGSAGLDTMAEDLDQLKCLRFSRDQLGAVCV